jgi:hypothetical protein
MNIFEKIANKIDNQEPKVGMNIYDVNDKMGKIVEIADVEGMTSETLDEFLNKYDSTEFKEKYESLVAIEEANVTKILALSSSNYDTVKTFAFEDCSFRSKSIRKMNELMMKNAEKVAERLKLQQQNTEVE